MSNELKLSEQFNSIEPRFVELATPETLKKECHELTATNCWWLEFQSKDIFWKLAHNEQKLREAEISTKETAQQSVVPESLSQCTCVDKPHKWTIHRDDCPRKTIG